MGMYSWDFDDFGSVQLQTRKVLSICTLLLACGCGDATAPSNEAPPTFTVVGHGDQPLTSDLWVHGTVAYTGMYDLADTGAPTNTLWVWDVSNPAMPRQAASLVLDGLGSVMDVKIRADGTLGVITQRYPPDGVNGITLLDLSNSLSPRVITRLTAPQLSNVHNTWIEGDYVYACGNERGIANSLAVIDITNPVDPQVVSRFWAGSSACHDVYVRDGLAFVSHWDAGLVIVDVGNGIRGGSPTNPVEVGRVQTEGGNVHNAWYWPAAGYVFVGEESDRPGVVHVVDVSNLSNPVAVATFVVDEGNPHNFWLDEARGILYVAWWEQGLKAIDVNGELLGRLDTQERLIASITYGGDFGLGLVGSSSWGAQLHDGLVYVSEVSSGLWILRPEF